MQYPDAETIHLVMDNLNIHCCKSLTDVFGVEVGSEIWTSSWFTSHPPTEAWLNQAEIEIGIFSRQCLGTRRIPDLQALRRESRAWNRRVNATASRSTGNSTAEPPVANSAIKRIFQTVIDLDLSNQGIK